MASMDRDALKVLFRSTDGKNWKINTNWSTNADPSNWHGVKEVNKDGRVVKLNLFANNLRGLLSPAFQTGAFSNLTALSVMSNKITGPIPPELGDLGSLKILQLSDNQLSGEIPDKLGALKELEELFLAGNQLTGDIPKALGTLTKLKRLQLAQNKLSGEIPEALGALSKLRHLFLQDNKLTGTVPLGLWKLPSTKTMNIGGNLLTRFTDPEKKAAAAHAVLACMVKLKSSLTTEGNPWVFPPAAVVANGPESVRKFYDTWEQCDFRLENIHALKVVFVGAYGAGKTSLARSIKMGRGDRTPEGDENRRTTVGIDILPHNLSDGTECKIYDVAGQITYYGLHQFFLTERAVYVMVFDATKFEGLSGKVLDEAIEENILEWVSLLHMRTPLCTVMLVASHYDMLHGTPGENEQLLVIVEDRFSELHADWKSLRGDQSSIMDERMTILAGIFPVGCKLANESASYTAEDGLQAVDKALLSDDTLKQTLVVSDVPPSWVAARRVLERIGSANDGSSGDAAAVGACARPWELRSVIHAKFKSFVEEGRRNLSPGGPASFLPLLDEDGIRDSLDGAIELRAFSGTLISHDIFVVLDVMWLAGVLKPILDHRGVIKNEMGQDVFADRVLDTSALQYWADDLVDRGILRQGFARFLWGLKQQPTGDVDGRHEMEPETFEEILEEIGVTIPLPVDEIAESSTPAAGHDDSRDRGADLLVIMRLPPDANDEMRTNLSEARQVSLPDSSGGKSSLKAVFQFDHAGAPHGLPERVMALSHKIGMFSSAARWRLGGLFLLHSNGVGDTSSMILEYDKKSKKFDIEALGQSTLHFQAMRFVISALFHVARDFPGAGWTAWMECGMRHKEQKMYRLATSNEKPGPGARIIPQIRATSAEGWLEQRNLCSRRALDPRGSCTVNPCRFGNILDVTQPYQPQSVPAPPVPAPPVPAPPVPATPIPATPLVPATPVPATPLVPATPVPATPLVPATPVPAAPLFPAPPVLAAPRVPATPVPASPSDQPSGEEPSWCRKVYNNVLRPRSGPIATTFFTVAIGLFATATAVDDAKRATLILCYVFAALSLLVALIAAYVFVQDNKEGDTPESAARTTQSGPTSQA